VYFIVERTRVARWHIFKPKIPIWVNFGRSCNGRCWYILCPFGLFYGHLWYFVAIWDILCFLIYLFRFGTLYQEKSGNPGANHRVHSSTLPTILEMIEKIQKDFWSCSGAPSSHRLKVLFYRSLSMQIVIAENKVKQSITCSCAITWPMN
jgi:hypothetical protein